MCRNIHTLFNFDPPATADEVQAASLQYVRKISGFTKPSQANEAAFEAAVAGAMAPLADLDPDELAALDYEATRDAEPDCRDEDGPEVERIMAMIDSTHNNCETT